jgi:chromatin remodeling complex protein RSC6
MEPHVQRPVYSIQELLKKENKKVNNRKKTMKPMQRHWLHRLKGWEKKIC